MTQDARFSLAVSAALVVACGGGSDGASTTATSSVGTADASSSEGVTATSTSETSGTTSANTNAEATGSTGGLSPTAACQAYLACAAATIPGELGPLLETYGPEGSCWQSTPAVAEQCDMACEVGLMQLQEVFPDEPSCGGAGSSSSGAVDPTGGQPDRGMYSMCTDAAECGNLPIFCMTNEGATDGFCSETGCMNAAADCDPAPGGTATPTCVGPLDISGNDEMACALSCEGGRTCPDGMACTDFADLGMICA